MKLSGKITIQESCELKLLEQLVNNCKSIICKLYDAECIEIVQARNITIYEIMNEIDIDLSTSQYSNIISIKFDNISNIEFQKACETGYVRIELKEESELDL